MADSHAEKVNRARKRLENGELPLDALPLREVLQSVQDVMDSLDKFFEVALTNDLDRFPEEVRTPMLILVARYLSYQNSVDIMVRDLVRLDEAANINKEEGDNG